VAESVPLVVNVAPLGVGTIEGPWAFHCKVKDVWFQCKRCRCLVHCEAHRFCRRVVVSSVGGRKCDRQCLNAGCQDCAARRRVYESTGVLAVAYLERRVLAEAARFSIGKTTPVITGRQPAALPRQLLSVHPAQRYRHTPGAFVYTPTSGQSWQPAFRHCRSHLRHRHY